MRVGRQIPQRRPARFDPRSDRRLFVRLEVVHQDDVARLQMRHQLTTHPGEERHLVHRPPAGPERDPAVAPDRADQCQVVPPVHRARFHVFGPAWHPRMRSPHREVRARFIDKDQPLRINPPHPSQERGPFHPDVRAVDLTRPRPGFLSTYPSRCIARRKLGGVVRCRRATRRLYVAHNSALVASGGAATTWRSTPRSIGQRQPPPFGRGATDPRRRHWATHRSSVRWPNPNRAATSRYVPATASYAATARSRNTTSYGFAMALVKYTSLANSTGFRD